MYKFTFHFLLLTTACSFATGAFARQDNATQDTAHQGYDLGRNQLNKVYTQSITIKGEELERMPVSNLADAINAWLYGAYTNTATLLFAVDGNIINNVNTYSVYDIEEITFVQNAITAIAGANGQRNLVFIKTKKAEKERFNLQATIQQGIIASMPAPDGTKYTTSNYSQYHIGFSVNGKNISYGLSLNYQHDAQPFPKNNAGPGYAHTSPNIDRFRIHAWMSTQLNSNNELTLRISTAPQQYDANQHFSGNGHSTGYSTKTKETPINPSLRLYTVISTGLTNEFNAAYI